MTPGQYDPRSTMSAQQRSSLSGRGTIQVARAGGAREALVLGLMGVGVLGLGLWVFLHMGRARIEANAAMAAARPVPAAAATVVAPPPVAVVPAIKPAAPASTAQDNVLREARASVLVLDLTGKAPVTAAVDPGARSKPAGNAAGNGLLGDELFAQRAGSEQTETAHAVRMDDPSSTVAQGAVLPAVLETAINSDLPGFTRAIVSRDVRGFDGKRVLIPRGSRLVGKYKSGLASGQTRAYVIWTRLLLPDGSSVQLGSPLVDSDGETGVTGAVNRHFLARFGAATAFSVLGGLIASQSSSDTVVITSSAQAQSIASIALQNDGKIPPTIRVSAGEPIQVFVARDLVFDQ